VGLDAFRLVSRRCAWIVLTALTLVFCVLPAWADDEPQAIPRPNPEILRQLRQGGLTLYFRHGATDVSHPDRMPLVDLNDCATQRQLSDKGRAQASHIGEMLTALRIPAGPVLVSPFCRTQETARSLGRPFTVSKLLMPSSNLTSDEMAPVMEQLRQLLAEPVPAGQVRILVSHSTNLKDAANLFLKPEGSALVIKGDGGKVFSVLALIQPDDWDMLAAAAKGKE